MRNLIQGDILESKNTGAKVEIVSVGPTRYQTKIIAAPVSARHYSPPIIGANWEVGWKLMGFKA